MNFLASKNAKQLNKLHLIYIVLFGQNPTHPGMYFKISSFDATVNLSILFWWISLQLMKDMRWIGKLLQPFLEIINSVF